MRTNRSCCQKTGIRDVQGLVQSAQSVSQELMQIYDQGNAFIDDYIKNPEGALSEQAKSVIVRLQSNGYLPEPGIPATWYRDVKRRSLLNWQAWNTVTSWRASFVRTTRR